MIMFGDSLFNEGIPTYNGNVELYPLDLTFAKTINLTPQVIKQMRFYCSMVAEHPVEVTIHE